MYFIIAEPDITSWEKLLSGQAGFILATVLYGIFYWRVVMPARAKETEQLSRLADAISALVLKYTDGAQAKFDEIIKKLEDKE